MERSSHPVRTGFTQTQLLQAKYVGEVTDEHRATRRHIPSYPIDNVAPEVVSDRDDGVYVEAEHRGGGYRVHVTIADVAAHIRPGSPLAQAAWQRAFTLYGGSWTDPMFPNGPDQRLEEKMSLEHHRERLGLTISMTLDKHFKPIHTSFQPVITNPDNSSYSQAHERMLHDPQFQLMADIARGVKKHHFSDQPVPLDEIFSHRTLRRLQGSPDQLQAMEMVAVYMLLANNCTAEFARKADLPFLYRNFDETAGDTHATYGTKPLRHTALERMGLEGAYCHFTSPIRRAPDYFDAVMIHYAVDTIGMVEQRLRKAFPMTNPRQLHHDLWQHGPELLELLNQTGLAASRRVNVQKLLGDILDAASTDGQAASPARLRSLVSGLHVPPPPLDREQLQYYADHMNALARSPEVRAVEKQSERYEQSIERMETVSVGSRESLGYLSRDKFSSLLRAAATTGDMPRNLFEETRARIRSGEYDKLADSYTLFIEASGRTASRWTALKGLIATELKKDPSAVNAMIERLRDHVAPAEISEHSSALYGEVPEGREEPTRTATTLLVMRGEEMPSVAAPFYSIGHNQRAASSHARYSFLEHYAFGQLRPVEQTAMPSLLYAELDMEGAKKRELLGKMADEIGATLTFTEAETANGCHTQHITAQGGELSEPIVVEAEGDSAQEAEASAIRRLLRDETFKITVSREEQVARDLLNPQTVLDELVKARGGKIEFNRLPKAQGPHQAEAVITLDGRTARYASGGPNLDRAERNAAVKALEALGWEIAALPTDKAKSWVSDVQGPRAGAEASYYAGK